MHPIHLLWNVTPALQDFTISPKLFVCMIVSLTLKIHFKWDTDHRIPPIAGVGWHRILFSRRADSPFCSSTDALVRRWLMVSPSNCPVCLASADPNFLSCSNPTLCLPPRDPITPGMKAITLLIALISCNPHFFLERHSKKAEKTFFFVFTGGNTCTH